MASQSAQTPEAAPNRTRLRLTLAAVILAIALLAIYLAGWLPTAYDEAALAIAAVAVIFAWLWPVIESRRQSRAARTSDR